MLHPEQAVSSSEGQAREVEHWEKGHVLMSHPVLQTQVPGTEGDRWHGGISKAHAGMTQPSCRTAVTGAPWSAVGMPRVPLGEVQVLPPNA